SFKESPGIIAMVESADIDIVDVEQQPASGTPRQLGKKLPFRHFGIGEANIGRDVLQHDGAAKEILDQLNAADDMIECFARIGYGQEVVQILAVHPGPAEMIGNPFRLYPPR